MIGNMMICSASADRIQFTGKNCDVVLEFIGSPYAWSVNGHATDCPYVDTPEGRIAAQPGDWIIKLGSGLFRIDSSWRLAR